MVYIDLIPKALNNSTELKAIFKLSDMKDSSLNIATYLALKISTHIHAYV